MNINLELPDGLKDIVTTHFGARNLSKAQKYFLLSSVSISFKKGSMDTYVIISGIVKEDKNLEVKVVYKKRLEGTPEGPLKSQCTCLEWTSTDHCPHTAALFMSFLLQEEYESKIDIETFKDDNRPPMATFSSLGVSVAEYGSILKGPYQLEGANPGSTYSSLQYLLYNKQVINFPLPKEFNGKLILNVKTFDELTKKNLEERPKLEFQYLNSQDEQISQINIFESLYLFDWKYGEAFHLQRELKDFIQKLRIGRYELDINDIMQLTTSLTDSGALLLMIDGIPIDDIPQVEGSLRISLGINEEKNTQLKLSIEFYDEKEFLITPPPYLRELSFENGLLTSFKRKKDAYTFISTICNEDEDKVFNLRSVLLQSNQREKLQRILDFVDQCESSFIYDLNTKSLIKYNNKYLKHILASLHRNFGEFLFRYSTYSKENKSIFYLLSSTTLFAGLAKFNEELGPWGLQVYFNKQEMKKWSSKISFERKSSGTNWFDLTLNVTAEDLEIIKKADLDSGVALTSNGLILLSKEEKELARFMKKYITLEAKDDVLSEEDLHQFHIPFNKARIFELFELKRLGIEGALTQEEEDLCNQLSNLKEMPTYPIPEIFQDILRPYQKTGLNWLTFLYKHKLGACLADDMGLGKTLQTISFIKSVEHEIKKVLVVCPVSILLNWENEIKKFSDLTISLYHGGSREIDEDAKIILTSYGVMKREVETTFSKYNFDILVLDEVQHLKNIRSLGAFAARKLNANFRVCLTGTPVENDLSEFFNIIDLSVPGIWGDLNFIKAAANTQSRLIARKTASPFILRRTKEQVLTDLPPKVENTIYLEHNDQEKQRYKQTLIDIRDRITDVNKKRKYGEILKGLLQLRQSCLWQIGEDYENPLVNTARGGLNKTISTKIEFLRETLTQIIEEGHQTIIFSQFTTYLDIIQNVIEEKLWSHVRIDGSLSIKARQKAVDKFQAGDASIFLISLKAGGVGLNLTAASYVFIMDPWWNPAVENQAIDRAHRIGQKNSITVYRPIIKDSVEEKVLALQDRKKELFKELLPETDDQQFSGKLSMTDFEHLLSL